MVARLSNITIQYLCDNLHCAGTVAHWVYDEFIKPVRNDLSYEQVLSNFECCHKDALPIRFVAVKDNKCVGTVSLVHNDLKCREYTPWLAALYVDEQHRNEKIGEQLVEHVKGIASSLGYVELFLRTEHAIDYYKRLCWQHIEECDDNFGLRPSVFKFVLRP